MKKFLSEIWLAGTYMTMVAGVTALIGFAFILPPSLLLQSCRQVPTVSQENTDQIILRAEQTAETARLTFDTFVNLERDNEAMLKKVSPAIHDYANTIRRHGLDWVTSLRNATKVFEANRTAQNQANLNTWLATLNNAVTQTNTYIQQSKSAIGH